MDGVAYTTGSDTSKEIHFSCQHIVNCAERCADEIRGVLVHEVVHCYQYNGQGACPSGLIEGIAGAYICLPGFGTSFLRLRLHPDWVRLRSGFEPPHWRPGGSRWDEGYHVTAYFLQWLTERYGEGTVPEINELMKSTRYDEHIFKTVTGRKVSKLWKLYKEHLEGGGGTSSDVEGSSIGADAIAAVIHD